MPRDGLRIEKNARGVHWSEVNIYMTFFDGTKTVESKTIQAPSRRKLEAEIAGLPDQLKNEYEDPSKVSVEVEASDRKYMSRKEFQDYIRQDNLDTERQIDKWLL